MTPHQETILRELAFGNYIITHKGRMMLVDEDYYYPIRWDTFGKIKKFLTFDGVWMINKEGLNYLEKKYGTRKSYN